MWLLCFDKSGKPGDMLFFLLYAGTRLVPMQRWMVCVNPVKTERCGSVCWCSGLQITQFLCCRGHGLPLFVCGCRLPVKMKAVTLFTPT